MRDNKDCLLQKLLRLIRNNLSGLFVYLTLPVNSTQQIMALKSKYQKKRKNSPEVQLNMYVRPKIRSLRGYFWIFTIRKTQDLILIRDYCIKYVA